VGLRRLLVGGSDLRLLLALCFEQEQAVRGCFEESLIAFFAFPVFNFQTIEGCYRCFQLLDAILSRSISSK
jgi:hypothetical protein